MNSHEKLLKNELEWLYSTQFFGIKLGLENIGKLLGDFLAYPPPSTKIIQVAGTNGKGSTSAMIDSVARSHGIKTGLFTSPHLVEFNERIRLSGMNIPDHMLATLLKEVRELVRDWETPPTFFELSLAVAMRYFKEQECELIILEVGMGGRLDATSAVPNDVSVITPIGMDHQQYLGDTLEEIAGEKGAIMREGKPCISSPQEPKTERTLEVIANKRGCELSFIKEPLAGYEVGLHGKHQRWNASLALEALHKLGLDMRYECVTQGLKSVSWPGRFQIVKAENETVLDCCHNVHAAQALVAQWKSHYGDRKAHLIFGAAKDKNISGVIKEVLPICESVQVYEFDSNRAETAEKLIKVVRECDSKMKVTELTCLEGAEESSLRLVTGSLFLVGEWMKICLP